MVFYNLNKLFYYFFAIVGSFCIAFLFHSKFYPSEFVFVLSAGMSLLYCLFLYLYDRGMETEKSFIWRNDKVRNKKNTIFIAWFSIFIAFYFFSVYAVGRAFHEISGVLEVRSAVVTSLGSGGAKYSYCKYRVRISSEESSLKVCLSEKDYMNNFSYKYEGKEAFIEVKKSPFGFSFIKIR